MSHEIRPDYQTQYLFPRSLEEWVGSDDPARYVREFVDELDLSTLGLTDKQEALRHDTHGRPHYAPDMLLKLWLYAYMRGIRSSRALERGCRELLPLVWLAGLYVPDHNTLWRFWNRYREVIRQVFRQSVRVAMESNLVGMVMQAVDGTKIRSAGSKKSGWHKADLEKALSELDQKIERLEKEIATEGEQDEQSGGGPGAGPGDRLPKELEKREVLRERIREALGKLEQEKLEHMHPHDPEARIMVSHGRSSFAYNAQAMADQKAGIIVAEDVTIQENDEHQLVPMLEQAKQHTGAFAQTTVADSGYHTAEGLAGAEAIGADVLVAVKQKERELRRHHTQHFTYDAETDSVQCPERQTLPRSGTKNPKDKPYPVQTYHCRVFRTCPVAQECSKDPHGRTIEIGPHHQAVVRNRAHPNARELLMQRQIVAERPFAEMKETLGLRRWTVRGLEKVKAQWSMMCTAMNLRRMFAAAMSLRRLSAAAAT